MFFENRYCDNQPMMRVGSFPVYGTTILVAALVVGLVVFSLVGGNSAAAMCAFEPEQFWRHGQIWRALSYLMVGQLDFFTIFNLLFLYSFGRDCEQEMGRKRYFAFLGLLIATPVLISTLIWLSGFGGGVAGSAHLAMGLVIAFATIYPNVEWWALIPMKFVAIGCMFLAVVGHLRVNDESGLGSTLVTCAVSFGYIRAMRAGAIEGIALPGFFRRKSKSRGKAARESDAPGEMDSLLDKIAKTGMDSLTAKEHARLQSIRNEIMKRDRR